MGSKRARFRYNFLFYITRVLVKILLKKLKYPLLIIIWRRVFF